MESRRPSAGSGWIRTANGGWARSPGVEDSRVGVGVGVGVAISVDQAAPAFGTGTAPKTAPKTGPDPGPGSGPGTPPPSGFSPVSGVGDMGDGFGVGDGRVDSGTASASGTGSATAPRVSSGFSPVTRAARVAARQVWGPVEDDSGFIHLAAANRGLDKGTRRASEANSGIRTEFVNGREERVDAQGFRERAVPVPVVGRENKGKERRKEKDKEKEKKGGLKRIVEGMGFGGIGGGKKGKEKEKMGMKEVVGLATEKAKDDWVGDGKKWVGDGREYVKVDERKDENKEARTKAALRWAEREQEIKAQMEERYHLEARSPIRRTPRPPPTELERRRAAERSTPTFMRTLARTETQTSWNSSTDMEDGYSVERNTPASNRPRFRNGTQTSWTSSPDTEEGHSVERNMSTRVQPLHRTGTQTSWTPSPALEERYPVERNTPASNRPRLRTGTGTSWTSLTESGQEMEGNRSSAGESLDRIRGEVDELKLSASDERRLGDGNRACGGDSATILTPGSSVLSRPHPLNVNGKVRVVKSSRDREKERFERDLRAADARLASVRDGRGWIKRSL